MKRFWFVVLAVLVVATMVPQDASASARKVWNLDIASTIAPNIADTSTVITTAGMDDLIVFVAYEGDSATIKVEQSDDQVTWYTMSTVVTNGVDGTTAIQLHGPVVQTGIASAAKATLTDNIVPPLAYSRMIFTNHDKADADTCSSIVAKFICNR